MKKKKKLFYKFTNKIITINIVKLYPNIIMSFNRSFQLYIVEYTMSVLGESVLGTFP